MRKLGYLALIAVLGLLLASVAIARPGYRTTAITQLMLVPDSGQTRLIGCTYCHVNANGGAPWNAFGNEVRANFKGNIGDALYETLKAMKDGDGDGYADVLEVFAGTLPGDKDSRPLVTAEALMANLTKAGGVDMYKPK
jgi:hypothetical protein